jgi:hypothetical protein
MTHSSPAARRSGQEPEVAGEVAPLDVDDAEDPDAAPLDALEPDDAASDEPLSPEAPPLRESVR